MALGTFTPTQDNGIRDDSPTTNFSTDDNYDVGEYNAGVLIRRVLAQFDISSIPGGQIINAGTLRVSHQASDFSDNDRQMQVYRVRRVWGDTTSTWNIYSTGNNWQTAGATGADDIDTTGIGSVTIVQTQGAGWINVTLTTSAVSDWYTGAFANNGVLLRMDTELNDMHRWDSRENLGTLKPELVVDYSAAAAGAPLDLTSKYW